MYYYSTGMRYIIILVLVSIYVVKDATILIYIILSYKIFFLINERKIYNLYLIDKQKVIIYYGFS